MKKLSLYIFRWLLSTPILAVIVYFFIDYLGSLGATILANFIGSLIFYKVDKLIFR